MFRDGLARDFCPLLQRASSLVCGAAHRVPWLRRGQCYSFDMTVDHAGEQMKTTIQSMLVAVALVTASASGMAPAAEVAANNGATSVAEMMQKKQERHLRAQLVTESRPNPVRQLDEGNTTRKREKQENRYTKINKELGRRGNAEGQSPCAF
jgi:hypothetical protein